VLQVGFGQAAVAGVAGVGHRDGLADGAFYPGAEPVGVGEAFGGLPSAGLGEGLVDAAGADGQLPATAGGGGALGLDRAGAAGGGVELDHEGLDVSGFSRRTTYRSPCGCFQPAPVMATTCPRVSGGGGGW
jgi:hypothetical protein